MNETLVVEVRVRRARLAALALRLVAILSPALGATRSWKAAEAAVGLAEVRAGNGPWRRLTLSDYLLDLDDDLGLA